MEVSRNSLVETRKRTGLGRCRHFFWLGVVFDTVGATVLFTGVFTDLLFYDLLLYLGSIIIFFSLLWWVFWYTGNIESIPDETLKRLYHVPSASVVSALNRAGSPSFTFTVRTFSATLGQLRPGRRRRSLLRRTPSLLNKTLTGQVEKQLAKEDQVKGGMRNVKESGDAEGFGREELGPEQEEAKSSEGVCAPGPDACPLGPEAGRPATHLMRPEFTPSLVARPLPPTILAPKSLPVVLLPSPSQPPAILYSKSLSTVSLAPMSQSPIPLASTSLPAVPLSFKGQPVDTLASETQTAAPVVSQSLPLVPVAAQSHFQVPVASESHLQNLSPTSQTQPPAVQAAQAQALATQFFRIQLLPAPCFQSQSADPKITLAVQDTLHDTQQAPKSTALIQETALSQSSHAQEPPAGQELSQEVPDTVSQLPTSLAPATEAQRSMPNESAPSLRLRTVAYPNTEPDAQASAK